MEKTDVKCTSLSTNPSFELSEELDSISQLEDRLENKVRDVYCMEVLRIAISYDVNELIQHWSASRCVCACTCNMFWF